MITSPALGRYGRRPTTSFRAGLAAIGTAFNAADERRLRSIRARHLRGAARIWDRCIELLREHGSLTPKGIER